MWSPFPLKWKARIGSVFRLSSEGVFSALKMRRAICLLVRKAIYPPLFRISTRFFGSAIIGAGKLFSTEGLPRPCRPNPVPCLPGQPKVLLSEEGHEQV